MMVVHCIESISMFWAGRSLDKIKADAHEKGDLGIVAEVC